MEILENNRALALRVAAGGVVAAFISLGYYRLRKWVAGNACTSQTDLTGKTVVITGGNAGLGLETALNLAGRNAHVILACRSVERGEKAAVFVRRRTGNQNVIFMKLDLASLKSVRLFSEALHKQESCVDILINNAGVSYSSYQQTEDGFEAHMGVNHLGHFLLTNLLLDLLKNSPSARVVNVTSSLYKNCPKFEFDRMNDNSPSRYSIGIPGRAYSMSKLANILFTRSLAKHLEGSNVSVYVVGPGLVNTNLKRNTPALIRVSCFVCSFSTPLVSNNSLTLNLCKLG